MNIDLTDSEIEMIYTALVFSIENDFYEVCGNKKILLEVSNKFSVLNFNINHETIS